jgi:hypothetical protein
MAVCGLGSWAGHFGSRSSGVGERMACATRPCAKRGRRTCGRTVRRTAGSESSTSGNRSRSPANHPHERGDKYRRPVATRPICPAVSACRPHRRSQVQHSGPLVEQTRALTRRILKWPGAGLNRRHRNFQSRALPTELPGPRGARLIGSDGAGQRRELRGTRSGTTTATASRCPPRSSRRRRGGSRSSSPSGSSSPRRRRRRPA